MNDAKQPEALRLAAWLNEGAWAQMMLGDVMAAGRELRRLHAENESLRAGYAAALPEPHYAPLTGRTVDELTYQQQESAIAAYKRAHGHAPDFSFAPDRSWIEGAAYVDADRAMRAAQPAGAQQPNTDPKLLQFYDVTTDAELIEAQAAHIEKLQSKLPKPPSSALQRVREG